MNAYAVLKGGAAPIGVLSTPTSVSVEDINDELGARGYYREVAVPVVPGPQPGQILTKTMAISVAIDEALAKLNISHTPTHPFRCPSGTCPIESATYQTMADWCESVANGYLGGQYALPGWAQAALNAGALRGLNGASLARLGGVGPLGGFGDWLTENPWFLKSVGDSITNYGEYLTAQNVKAAIEANTAQRLTKDDALALVQALQAGGYVPAGKAATVSQGANLATGGATWVLPVAIGGGVLLALMMLKK